MREANEATNGAPEIVHTDGRTTQTILLVDDEDVVRGLMCEALKRQGYEVLTCSDPAEGIKASRQHRGEIDLLLTDVAMPGMNGCDMAKQIREIIPELRVVFMSGYTEDALTWDGEVEPQFEYLQKPFTLRALSRKLAQVLGQE
jgi:DNA-binding NtrC family response regulator